ncbi:MAG TPA: hypothetical protein VFY70_12605 [Thermomicrobiales bacterium]|nr:hypothetical protein [Thermomicrobiales bacterium]
MRPPLGMPVPRWNWGTVWRGRSGATGRKLVTPPTESGGLTFVHVADPAGTVIGIYTD